jgi:hypothetical protein
MQAAVYLENGGPRGTSLSEIDEVLAVHEGVPSGVSPADNELGW